MNGSNQIKDGLKASLLVILFLIMKKQQMVKLNHYIDLVNAYLLVNFYQFSKRTLSINYPENAMLMIQLQLKMQNLLQKLRL